MPVDLTCDHCGAHFRLPPSHARGRRFCSETCMGKASRKATTSFRRIVHIPGHPVAPPGGIVPVYRLVLYDRIGGGSHPCHWCGDLVEWMPGARLARGALVVDHVDGDWSNNDPSNLVPSCQACNGAREKRVRDTEPYVLTSRGRTRAVERVCHTCGANFLIAPADARAKPNAGKYCSRACMYARSR